MTSPQNETSAHDQPTLDDVIEPTEQAFPDHREHAKANPRPDDDYLAARTEHEREEISGDA